MLRFTELKAAVSTSCFSANLALPAPRATPSPRLQAREELAKLGPMSTDEKLTAFAFAITVGLWIFGGSIGVNAVAAALTGLSILLITGKPAQPKLC